jgi:ubiquinone/menaquinone biosynthesis C-methylase UbiE
VGSKVTIYEKAHFGFIRFVHDTLFGVFVDPYDWLGQSGIASGQSVLEVGCGPGFFTIPAAELVGESGHLCALDNNPAAVDHVRKKVLRRALKNVDVVLADAFRTGTPDQSFDVVFLYGVIHDLWDRVGSLILELHRITKVGGVLSISKSPWIREERIADEVTKAGLFRLLNKTERVLNFERLQGDESS